MKTAVIMTGDDAEGVQGEYAWKARAAPGARVTEQALLIDGQRKYDKLDVVLPDGTAKAFYFDITTTIGKLF